MKKAEEEERAIENEIASQRGSYAVELPIHDIKRAVAEFAEEFLARFDEMPIEQKKLQVRRCISRIVIDKERAVAQAYIRRIPAVVPELEELYENKRAPTGLVSARSSGGRT